MLLLLVVPGWLLLHCRRLSAENRVLNSTPRIIIRARNIRSGSRTPMPFGLLTAQEIIELAICSFIVVIELGAWFLLIEIAFRVVEAETPVVAVSTINYCKDMIFAVGHDVHESVVSSVCEAVVAIRIIVSFAE